MRKGMNKMALHLFEHNKKAYHAAVPMVEQYGSAAIATPRKKATLRSSWAKSWLMGILQMK